jgi:hypothetical protein
MLCPHVISTINELVSSLGSLSTLVGLPYELVLYFTYLLIGLTIFLCNMVGISSFNIKVFFYMLNVTCREILLQPNKHSTYNSCCLLYPTR